MENPKIYLHQELDYFSLPVPFFYKQPVYKQLVFGWQFAKQGEGSTLFLSERDRRLKKKGVFPL